MEYKSADVLFWSNFIVRDRSPLLVCPQSHSRGNLSESSFHGHSRSLPPPAQSIPNALLPRHSIPAFLLPLTLHS